MLCRPLRNSLPVATLLLVAAVLLAADPESIGATALELPNDVQPSPVPDHADLGEGDGFPGPFAPAVVDAKGTGGYTRRTNYYNELRPTVDGVTQNDYKINCGGDSYDMESGTVADMGTAQLYPSVYTDKSYNADDADGAQQVLTPCIELCNQCKADYGNDCMGFIDLIRLGKCFFVNALVYTEAQFNEPLEHICRDVGAGEDECRSRQRYFNAVKSYEKCPEGTFSDVETDWELAYVSPYDGCKTCPTGWYSDHTNMGTTCHLCAPGRISNPSTGFGACTVCDAGKYSDNRDSDGAVGLRDYCKTCEATTYATQESPHCILCPIGTYGNQELRTDQYGGASECQLCAPGQYNNQEGQTACVDCPAGWEANFKKSTTCKDCVAGQYNAQGCYNVAGEVVNGVLQCFPAQAACKHCPLGQTVHGSTGGLPGTMSMFTRRSTQSTPKYGTQAGCWNCQPGTYNVGAGAYPCLDCEGGRYQGLTEQSTCINCAVGKYENQGGQSVCKECPSGFYQDVIQQADCKACDFGRYTAVSPEPPTAGAVGKNTCAYCVPGTYNDALGSSVCKNCGSGQTSNPGGPGSFSTAHGRTGVSDVGCDSCPAGYFQDQSSSPPSYVTDCKACPAGWSQGVERQTGCTQCAGGKYHEQTAQAHCKVCPAGHSSAGRSDGRYCMACAFGKHQGNTERTQCDTCPQGQHADHSAGGLTTTLHSCVQPGCLPVKTSAYTGANICTPCTSGKYVAYPGGVTICTDCISGKYSSADAAQCEDCDAGSYSNIEAAVCTECPVGWWESEEGTPTGCKNCPKGWYQGTQGESFCTVCDAGFYAPEDCTQSNPRGSFLGGQSCRSDCTGCVAGKYSASQAHVCTDCANGKYSTSSEPDRCKECPTGWYEDADGSPLHADGCKNCPSGFHAASQEASSCRSCPAGYHADGCGETNPLIGTGWMGGQASCKAQCTLCASGYYARTDASSCMECEPGQVSKDGAPNCEACPTGRTSGWAGPADTGAQVAHHTPTELYDMCLACDAGKGTGGATGEASCTDCSNGKYSTSASMGGSYVDMALCETCPNGWFSDSDSGSSICKQCHSGRYSDAYGGHDWHNFGDNHSCKECPAGYIETAGRNSCAVCPAGKKSNANGGSTSCGDCPGGQCSGGGGECAHTVSHECKSCPHGHYVASGTNTACAPCTSGQYAGIGAGGCTNCPNGQYNNANGQSACTNCAQGFYQSGSTRTRCYNCGGSNQYQNDPGKAGCKSCADGQIHYSSDHDGAFGGTGYYNCKQCDTGRYKSGDSCVLCAAGKFTDQVGRNSASDCKSCAFGQHHDENRQGCKSCPSGWYANQGWADCQQCAGGKVHNSNWDAAYTDQSDRFQCVNCPAGQKRTTSSGGSPRFCTTCSAGQYTASTGTSDSCVGCTGTQYQDQQGASGCKSCSSANYYRSSSTACDACPTGWSSDGSTTSCTEDGPTYLSDARDQWCYYPGTGLTATGMWGDNKLQVGGSYDTAANGDGSRQANENVKSKYRYTAPFKISWKMRQVSSGSGTDDQCGCLHVLWNSGMPDARHASYNSGLGWWVDYFGYGYATSVQDSDLKVESPSTLWGGTWRSMEIDVGVAASDSVTYKMDTLTKTVTSGNGYSDPSGKYGHIMIGHQCMHFEFKDIFVDVNGGTDCAGGGVSCHGTATWEDNCGMD